MNYLLFTAILLLSSCSPKVIDDIIQGEVNTIESVVKDEIGCASKDGMPVSHPEETKKPLIKFCRK